MLNLFLFKIKVIQFSKSYWLFAIKIIGSRLNIRFYNKLSKEVKKTLKIEIKNIYIYIILEIKWIL